MFVFFLINKFSITAQYSKDTQNSVLNKHLLLYLIKKTYDLKWIYEICTADIHLSKWMIIAVIYWLLIVRFLFTLKPISDTLHTDFRTFKGIFRVSPSLTRTFLVLMSPYGLLLLGKETQVRTESRFGGSKVFKVLPDLCLHVQKSLLSVLA